MMEQAFALVFAATVMNSGQVMPVVAQVYDNYAACEASNTKLLEDKVIEHRGECIPMEAIEGVLVLSPGTYGRAPDAIEPPKATEPAL